MPIQVTCHHCHKRLNAPDQMAGARVKCPSCRAVIQIPDRNEPESSLVDLLEEVTAAPPAAAMARPAGGPFSSGPTRPAAKGTPAWKQGGIAFFLKAQFWTVVTLLCGLFMAISFESVFMLIPGLINAAIVFASEQSRQNRGPNEKGLSPVDRVLFGIVVCVQLVSMGVGAFFGAQGAVQQQPNAPQGAIMAGVLIGTLVGTVVVALPLFLIIYLCARAFGLGRTQAVFNLAISLIFLTTMVAVGRNPLLAARQAAEAARLAAEAKKAGGQAGMPGQGGPPGAPPGNVGNVPFGAPQANLGNPPPGMPQQAPQGAPQVPNDRRIEPPSQIAQDNPPANPVSRREKMADVMLMQKGLKELDFNDRLKQAFAWNKVATRDLLAGRLIASDDNNPVVQALRRAPSLERPMMNLQFVLGISGFDLRPRSGTDWGEQKGAEGDYRRTGGDAGMLLLRGLMTRVARGSCGDWGCDVQPPQESDPRAVLFAIADSEDSLQTFAAQQNVDILISLNMTGKATGSNTNQNRGPTLVVSLVDVASNTELWASKPLTSTAIAAGRAKGADPGIQVVNELLEYLDQNLTLEPLPPGSAADAVAEADRLTADKNGDILLKLATLRVYQCQGLITPDQAVEYAGRLLDHDSAQDFASDEPLDRVRAIARLLPKR